MIYRAQITSAAQKHRIDPALVYAVCRQESGMDQHAFRYEPAYRWLVSPNMVKPMTCSVESEIMLQKTSIGIMQVMGAVFREYGFTGWLSALFGDMNRQLDYGCLHLAKKISRYGLPAGIAAYNSGSPRELSNEKFVNQHYVDNVIGYMEMWKTEAG